MGFPHRRTEGKAKQCRTPDELTALAGREGIELPDELLDAVAGGYIFYNWDTKYSERWEVIRDKDGKVMERFNEDQKEAAKAYAKAHGQSEEQIGWARINEIRKAANPLSC